LFVLLLSILCNQTCHSGIFAEGKGRCAEDQAAEVVQEIEHIREGKHVARSTKQAIAIGLSKATSVTGPGATLALERV
jgi:hypothetical protein